MPEFGSLLEPLHCSQAQRKVAGVTQAEVSGGAFVRRLTRFVRWMPARRIELRTFCLQDRCSTTEPYGLCLFRHLSLSVGKLMELFASSRVFEEWELVMQCSEGKVVG